MNCFKEGFFYFAQNFGSEYGMCCGSQYIENVNEAIMHFADILNNQFAGYKTNDNQLN